MRINPAFLSAALVIVAAGCKPGGSAGGSGDQHKIQHLTKLIIKDEKVGTGDPIRKGDEAWVLYTGRFQDGKTFDTNLKQGGLPFHVTVGSGDVIEGWAEGLIGMKKGGKRMLSIPYALAYGANGRNGIPPESDLFFGVEVVSVLKKEDASGITVNVIKPGKGRPVKKGDTVTIDYVAKANGEEYEKKENVTFKIGNDEMQIPGFDDALIGMTVGGLRQIIIPPALTRTLRNDKLGMNVGEWFVTLKSIN